MVSAEDPRLVDTDILVEATVIGWRMRDVGNDVSLAETSVTIAAPPKHFPVRCWGPPQVGQGGTHGLQLRRSGEAHRFKNCKLRTFLQKPKGPDHGSLS